MLTYQKISKHPSHFLRYTGLTIQQFDRVYNELAPQAERARQERLFRPDRLRGLGGGGQYHLSLRDRFVMTLCYHRLYLSHALLSYLFDLDSSNVCRNIRELRPLIEAVLPNPKRVLAKVVETAKRISTPEELFRQFPDLKTIIDATEQPIQRPKDKKKRDAHYSGRRKRTTKKRQERREQASDAVTHAGILLDQSPGVPGRVHDFTLFKEHYGASPPFADLLGRTIGYADSGYQGIEDFLPSTNRIRLIQRARRNRPLTVEQRKLNSLRSSIRIGVEHTLSRVKKYRIASEVYRGSESAYDSHMNLVAGLVNLRTLDLQGIAL